MRKFRFYKDSFNSWYVDLPEWTGDIEDLQMVLGADKMLDYLSDGEDEICLYLSPSEMKGAKALNLVLNFKEFSDNNDGGAIYEIFNIDGEGGSLQLWLCDVTEFVFGEFPVRIFIAKADK